MCYVGSLCLQESRPISIINHWDERISEVDNGGCLVCLKGGYILLYLPYNPSPLPVTKYEDTLPFILRVLDNLNLHLGPR